LLLFQNQPLAWEPPEKMKLLITGSRCCAIDSQEEELTKAIEGIVDAYVKLGDRRALEDLRMHRRRLAIDLNGRSGPYDFSRPLGQINEEIAAIEAGLERLNTALTKSPVRADEESEGSGRRE
jgi:hypothetical protein